MLLRTVFSKLRKQLDHDLFKLRVELLRKEIITREDAQYYLEHRLNKILQCVDLNVDILIEFFSKLVKREEWELTLNFRDSAKSVFYYAIFIAGLLHAAAIIEKIRRRRFLKVIENSDGTYRVTVNGGRIITFAVLSGEDLYWQLKNPVYRLIALLNELTMFPDELNIAIGIIGKNYANPQYRDEYRITLHYILYFLRRKIDEYTIIHIAALKERYKAFKSRIKTAVK